MYFGSNYLKCPSPLTLLCKPSALIWIFVVIGLFHFLLPTVHHTEARVIFKV